MFICIVHFISAKPTLQHCLILKHLHVLKLKLVYNFTAIVYQTIHPVNKIPALSVRISHAESVPGVLTSEGIRATLDCVIHKSQDSIPAFPFQAEAVQ